MLLAGDGGVYASYDQGKSWDHLNTAAIGQFYHVAIDTRPVYNVYGGLQDNGTWGGPARSRDGGSTNTDWIRIGGGDGFVCAVDPNDPDQIYSESQNGATSFRNLRTGRTGSLRPPQSPGIRYRFNWKTPFIISNHNPGIYYSAGNYVLRTLAAGKTMKRISPEITRTDKGSASALAESPVDSDVLYVGTDDGALWATRDGGKNWTDLFKPLETPSSEPTRGAGPMASAENGRGGGRNSILSRMDTNGDGKIQRDELPERIASSFDQLDANSDGVLDETELAAMRGRLGGGGGRRGRWRGPRPRRRSTWRWWW
jgi:hypothetical protein